MTTPTTHRILADYEPLRVQEKRTLVLAVPPGLMFVPIRNAHPAARVTVTMTSVGMRDWVVRGAAAETADGVRRYFRRAAEGEGRKGAPIGDLAWDPNTPEWIVALAADLEAETGTTSDDPAAAMVQHSICAVCNWRAGTYGGQVRHSPGAPAGLDADHEVSWG